MSNNSEDLITIVLLRKKKEGNKDAEVMASEDDENPEGAQSTDDRKYRIFISPEILAEIRRKKARAIVINGDPHGGTVTLSYK